MKKKVISLLVFSILSSFIFAMSKNKIITVNGYVKTYGNEPFTFIGIETSKGNKYSLKADDEVMQKLKNLKGIEIELEGIVIKPEGSPNELKDGTFEVHSWKVK